MATTIEPDLRRESAAKAAPPTPPAAEPKPGGQRRTVFTIMGLVLLALVAFGARRWIYGLSHVSTDDAQVDGHIIPILPKVGGFVTEVRIDENQRVKGGDTLVVLDDRDYRVRLAQADADLAVALAGVSNRARVGQAEAQVEQAQANASKAHADLDRVRRLRRVQAARPHHTVSAVTGEIDIARRVGIHAAIRETTSKSTAIATIVIGSPGPTP